MKHVHIYPPLALEDTSLSENAQRALCLVKSLLPELSAFEDHKEDQRNRIADLELKIQKCNEEIEQKQKSKREKKTETEQLRIRMKKTKQVIREEIHKPWKFILVRWLWFFLFKRKWKRNLDILLSDLKSLKHEYFMLLDEMDEIDNDIESIRNDIQAHKDSIADITHSIEMLPPVPKILSGIGEVNIPFVPIKLMDKKLQEKDETKQEIYTIIDIEGKKSDFRIPYLDIDYDILLDNLEKIESFRTDEVLIKPHEDEKEKWGNPNELIGKEKELLETIKEVKEILEKTEVKKYILPVIELNNPIAKLIQDFINTHALEKPKYPKTEIDEIFIEKLDEIEDDKKVICTFLNEDFERVRIIDNRLQTIKDEIDDIHTKTTKLRKESSEFLSQFLNDMRYYSELSSNYFFCPKCNITHDYLDEIIGIKYEDIGNFEKLTTNELSEKSFNFLEDEIFNDESGAKISNSEKERIRGSWKVGFDNLHTLENEITILLNEDRKTDSNVYKLAIMREVATKKQLYRNIVMSILRTHRNEWKIENVEVDPGEEMSLNIFKNTKKYYTKGTNLKYNIEAMNWKCPFCNSQYDYEYAKLGTASKIVYDLEIPVLNTLWNDEKVWNQLIDLHRDISREHGDRMVEESNSIQDAINQFLADSRQLRQTIQAQFAKSSAAIKRVQNLEDKFNKFDLLDEKTVNELQRIGAQNAEKLEVAESLLVEMDDKENDLARVPKMIAFETQLTVVNHLKKNINLLEKK